MKFKNILFTGTTAAVIATCVGSAFAADPMRLPTQGYVDAKIKPVDERSQANEQLLGRDTLQTTAQQVTGAINELVAGKLNTFDRAGNAIVVTDENGALQTKEALEINQVSQLQPALDAKQDLLTANNAGLGITITTNEDGVLIISSETGESVTYSPGDWIQFGTPGDDGSIPLNVITTEQIRATYDTDTDKMVVADGDDKVVTAAAVVGYALPNPPRDCGESACVLGVDGTGAPYWMKLELSLEDSLPDTESGDETTTA